MLTLLFAVITSASTPHALVQKFCAAYVKQHEYGLLEGKDRRTIAPFLTARLLRRLDDAHACQRDWFRHQPKDTTDKPPFVDCCLFSSVPDGMPTSFAVGAAEGMADGRTKVVINFAREGIHWRDAAIVRKENGRYAIDDFVYDLDRDAALLSTSFKECRAGRWVGE